MENKAQDKKEDKLILGGHEFNSRFILGSGRIRCTVSGRAGLYDWKQTV